MEKGPTAFKPWPFISLHVRLCYQTSSKYVVVVTSQLLLLLLLILILITTLVPAATQVNNQCSVGLVSTTLEHTSLVLVKGTFLKIFHTHLVVLLCIWVQGWNNLVFLELVQHWYKGWYYLRSLVVPTRLVLLPRMIFGWYVWSR
jgi:hypothetical protein